MPAPPTKCRTKTETVTVDFQLMMWSIITEADQDDRLQDELTKPGIKQGSVR